MLQGREALYRRDAERGVAPWCALEPARAPARPTQLRAEAGRREGGKQKRGARLREGQRANSERRAMWRDSALCA